MMKIFGLLAFCALAIGTELNNHVIPLVYSPTGIYHGSILKSIVGKDIYSFRGIRYADAPTGRDRFKQATIVKPHSGIYEATADGPLCPQPPLGNRLIAENCLNLNIYTTKLPTNSTGNLSSNESIRPVLVFLHSGNFVTSSGSSYDLNPRNMLIRDIILVTLNYRLGALGFLSTGDKRAPGNAGLKDQVLALRWIQKNIRSFGGNPDSVTLGGHNSGAWSVSLHIVSPMSKGLFHRAFIMSGATIAQNYLPTNQLDIAKKQAQILGCPIDTLDNMFNCFYTKSYVEFGNSIKELTDLNIYSMPIYTPVIEQVNTDINNNEETFLTAQPADIIRQGKANFVPFVTGFDKIDFHKSFIHAHNYGKNGLFATVDEFNKNWMELAPKLFGYNNNSRSASITRELTSFYLQNLPVTAGNDRGLGELYDDALTIFPMHRFERLMATYSTQPIHNYYDVYKGCGGFPIWSNGTHYSPPHYNELLLLFGIGSHPELCQRDAAISAQIMGMINNFMETGYPIPEQLIHEYPIKWEQSTADHPRYMEYNTTIRMVDGLIYPERMNKWDELFPIETVQ